LQNSIKKIYSYDIDGNCKSGEYYTWSNNKWVASEGDLVLAYNNRKDKLYLYGKKISVIYVGDNKIEEKTSHSFALSQNYPNPFNSVTKINFSITNDENVSLNIYNSRGEFIQTVVNKKFDKGNYSIDFDATKLNSGLYFYKLENISGKIIKKMIFVK